jgi:hypothetical protein
MNSVLYFNCHLYFCSDADDAIHDLDGKDMMGGRVRVELAKDPRDRNRRDGDRRDGGRRDGGGFGRGRDMGGRGRPPGPKTNYRILVENISSRTSWQVKTVSCHHKFFFYQPSRAVFLNRRDWECF